MCVSSQQPFMDMCQCSTNVYGRMGLLYNKLQRRKVMKNEENDMAEELNRGST